MLGFLLLASLFTSTLLAEDQAAEDGCMPVYRPAGINPATWDYINFSTAPYTMGVGPGQYNWYESLNGGIISDEGLFNGTTDYPTAVISNDIWMVPATGEIQAAAVFNFSSYVLSGDVISPLGVGEDPFYGAAFFGLHDQVDGWQFGFFVTAQKVYAWYSRFATVNSVGANYKLFSFLVPIYTISPASGMVKVAVVLNPQRFTASYRVFDEEKLLISNLGMPIDPRFEVACGVGFNEGPAFPSQLQLLIGVFPLTVWSNGSPHTACQRGLFNECTQSPYNAYLTFCQYAPNQDKTAVPYDIELLANFANWSLVYWDLQDDCHALQECLTPNLFCPGELDNIVDPCSTSMDSVPVEQAPCCPMRTPCRGPGCCTRGACRKPRQHQQQRQKPRNRQAAGGCGCRG